MINFISEFVSSGQINSQEAFLFLLIYSGVKSKEDLAKKTNLCIKTITRQLIEPLPLSLRLEVGDSRFISLATYYLHEPHIG